MKITILDIVVACALAGFAGLGGALAVYAEYDDAPGGVLIGLLMILGAAALGLFAGSRRKQSANRGLAGRTSH